MTVSPCLTVTIFPTLLIMALSPFSTLSRPHVSKSQMPPGYGSEVPAPLVGNVGEHGEADKRALVSRLKCLDQPPHRVRGRSLLPAFELRVESLGDPDAPRHLDLIQAAV